VAEFEQHIYNFLQIIVRARIIGFDSESLNEKRTELVDFKIEEFDRFCATFGIQIEQAICKDIIFPKSIQELFARQLESKIKAKADLENARTALSAAQALKSASELIKDQDYVKLFPMIEGGDNR
jgi:regulator of protease activity HflC (stomatin/prohibitin superfamily)